MYSSIRWEAALRAIRPGVMAVGRDSEMLCRDVGLCCEVEVAGAGEDLGVCWKVHLSPHLQFPCYC